MMNVALGNSTCGQQFFHELLESKTLKYTIEGKPLDMEVQIFSDQFFTSEVTQGPCP
jgi:hypothetical protein